MRTNERRYQSETIERLQVLNKGKAPMLGKRLSAETKERIGLHFRGKPLTPEHSQKIADALKDKGKSDQHRRRLSEVQARFSSEQVAEIRKQRSDGVTLRVLAEQYGCSVQTISNVEHGKRQAYQCQV